MCGAIPPDINNVKKADIIHIYSIVSNDLYNIYTMCTFVSGFIV